MHTCALASGKEASDNGYLWGRPIVAHKGLPDLGKGGIVAHLGLAKVVCRDEAQVPGIILAGMDALHGRQGRLHAAALHTAAAQARHAHVTGVMLAGTAALHGRQGPVRGGCVAKCCSLCTDGTAQIPGLSWQASMPCMADKGL